ncbi:MAG TPA: TIGR02611 family protein [Flexivirga sp.]|uniref:TIGR02611 family protein n=1 Tax=Flexivirga sp. TaxID=1962927 RepID=UPI002C2E93A1|nr:TIGR02611 family protein [Flexivirga sp.]HWC21017.1 TIGR02611 family protein [Flexivirga sp.]
MAGPPPQDIDRAVHDKDAKIFEERFAWRARIRANPTSYLFYRIGIGILGALVVAAGIVLLPLPGPGWVIIFVGIGIWATEFTWAKRLLRFAKEKVGLWTAWMGRQNWFVRALVGLGIVLLVAACFWLVFLVSGVPTFLPAQVKDWIGHLPGL